jgi:hypothetical protein
MYVKGSRKTARTFLCALAIFALGMLAVPVAGAGAEQIVIPLVDAPSFWEFDDPCTGDPVHGDAVENGVLRVTDLGDQGFHLRVQARGEVELLDDGDELVGTWTYDLRVGDQFPPDGQGAFHLIASGPVEYADGSTAKLHVHIHAVFEKGDEVKREFFKAVCSA